MTDTIRLYRNTNNKWAIPYDIFYNICLAYDYFVEDYDSAQAYLSGMQLSMRHMKWNFKRYQKRNNVDRLIHDFYYSSYNSVDTLTHAFYLILSKLDDKKDIEKFYAYGIKYVNHNISEGRRSILKFHDDYEYDVEDDEDDLVVDV